jgi:hypothetical protein
MMKTLFVALAAALVASIAGAADKDEGKTVKHAVYSSYFEKNNSGLKGDASYLAVKSGEEFDKLFGVAAVGTKKPSVLPKGLFDDNLVVAVIKRGDAPWKYDVEKVTESEGTLTVQYKASEGKGGGTAKFASPLVVSVPRAKIAKVVFVENGKPVGIAEVSK